MKKQLIAVITALTVLSQTIVLATGTDGEEQENYDIQLNQNYNYGDQKVTLDWTGVTDDTKLAQVAKVGDYVNYSISMQDVKNRFSSISSRIKRRTTLKDEEIRWRVMYNDGATVKLVSESTLCYTNIGGEDYNWYKLNPYPYGSYDGDCGGYGVYYQLDQIAKCFTNSTYASNVRALDIAELPHSQNLISLKENYLNQTDEDNISITIREEGYNEIYDNNPSKVGTITDDSGLYTQSEDYFIPNYYNGSNFLRSVYYVSGQDIYLNRCYKRGWTRTAGIRAVVTLKTGLYKTTGDGSKLKPWEISTMPRNGPIHNLSKSRK